MAQLRGLKEFSFTIGAGGEKTIGVEGDWCQVHECEAVGCQIAFDDIGSGTWYEGQGRRVYYKKVRVYSSTAQTIKLLLGFGHATDARAVVNANVTAVVTPGNDIDNGADVSCLAASATQLLAADADRLYALIKNPSTNTVTVRIGKTAVGAASGIPLEPGETLPFPTTAAIYAYNPDAGAVTISAMAVKLI